MNTRISLTGRRWFSHSISRYSKQKLSPRFLHEVPLVEKTTHLSKTERLVNSSFFNGTLNQAKQSRLEKTRKSNLGNFIQNQTDGSPIAASHLLNTDHIPYSHMSKSSISLNAAFELMNTSDFFVISSFSSVDQVSKESLLRQIQKHCQQYSVVFMPVKPVLLQACLWKLSRDTAPDPNTQSLDDFWLGNYVESYTDDLANKLKFKSAGDRLFTAIYCFSLESATFSTIEEVFSQRFTKYQRLLGVRFSSAAVGGPERLRSALKNISAPWELNGDDHTLRFAKVLKEFASKGLVKSSQPSLGSLYLTAKD